ncbi:hypothetical protein ACFFJX_14310 [Pseudarcicella hirudinis]|uniref:hypothetical protein n=1 Tax=Pseudarcicella hirudinis TaxID=1079859 RepID=UPI0035EA6D51
MIPHWFIRTPPVLVMGTNSTDDGVGKIDTGDDLKVWVNQVFDQPYTYEWRFNKVTTVIGTNREQTVLNVTAANTGTYKVNIVDQYGCTNSDSIKVRIKPLNCGLTILPTKVCYIENNRRYGKLQVNVVNITRNWSTFLKITKVKNADDEAIDSLFVNEFQAYTASSFQKVYDKISDGTYKIEALTKRIADQMTADTCRASAVIFLQVCQKKCGPMNHYINCGVTPTLDLTQEIFRETLAQGNIIAAADFDVNVQSATKVTNLTNASLNNYTFDGLGYIQVPYLNFVKVKVEMKQAVFNECNQLVSGTVLTTYDPNWKGVVNVGETADDVTAIYKELKDLTQALVNVNLGTLEERKAKGMAKQLLDTNNDLPKSLVDTKNELASRLTDINKKCNNGTYAQAECDTANAQYKGYKAMAGRC